MAACLLRLCTDAAYTSYNALPTHVVFEFLLGQDYSDPPISRHTPINRQCDCQLLFSLTFYVGEQVAIIRRRYCRYYRHQHPPRLLGRRQASVKLNISTRGSPVASRRILTVERVFLRMSDHSWQVLQRVRGTANTRRRSSQP